MLRAQAWLTGAAWHRHMCGPQVWTECREIADSDHQLHHKEPERTSAVFSSVHPDISVADSAQHPHSHGKRYRSQCARQRRSKGDGLIMMSHSLPPRIVRWNLSRSFRGCMELPVMREHTRSCAGTRSRLSVSKRR